ncbi:hypothetical protein ACCT14_34525, partial [Rhizobium brockwellii]|uniref:hypothetical protein n=1 Tax=Rhizobium brockwellii TaxID=3019932 RepID=UPI003F98D967
LAFRLNLARHQAVALRIAEPCVEKPLPTHLKLYFPENPLSAATDARGKIVANPLTAAISLSMSKGRYPSCGVCALVSTLASFPF